MFAGTPMRPDRAARVSGRSDRGSESSLLEESLHLHYFGYSDGHTRMFLVEDCVGGGGAPPELPVVSPFTSLPLLFPDPVSWAQLAGCPQAHKPLLAPLPTELNF